MQLVLSEARVATCVRVIRSHDTPSLILFISLLFYFYKISFFFLSLSCSFQCPGSTVCTLSVRSAGNASSSPQPCFVVYAFCFFGFFWYGILSYYYYSFFGQYKKSYISKNVCTFCNGTGFWCSVLVFFGLLLLLLFFFFVPLKIWQH